MVNNPKIKTLANYVRLTGKNILSRTEPFYEWYSERSSTNTWPYSKILKTFPGTTATVETNTGEKFTGINFASQDYLSLTSHPKVLNTAVEALSKFGPHSAGSAVLVGNTEESIALEEALSNFLGYENIILYPTGWAAGFGVINGLIKSKDYILMDELSHSCLQAGSYSATKKVFTYRHNDLEDVENQLKCIRENDNQNGILIITESLFSMDSDWPDLQKLQQIAHYYEATLLVDAAHDLGSMWNGGGQLARQNMTGKVDLVMGSFSKTFASNGGFVAVNLPSVKQYLKYFGSSHTFSNALSPVQCAVIRKCLEIVCSNEGEKLREKLIENSVTIRKEFREMNFESFGYPSPIVPIKIGDESVARSLSYKLINKGILANLVEYPAVAVGKARFRLQIQANHTFEECKRAAQIFREELDLLL